MTIQDVPIIQRAYQIARSGAAASYDDIVARLKQEGYGNVTNELCGPVLRKELRGLCAAARQPKHTPPL
jgi:hypothetical protein